MNSLDHHERINRTRAIRDHREIGKKQELFFFHELSPGSCFFQPHGAHIYNTLIQFMREQNRSRGYQEVVTPNMYNSKLLQTTGHWDYCGENMFSFEVEKEIFALKNTNCVGHCLMYDVRTRSWRELPLRLSDFGPLHRNVAAVDKLSHVRRFQQDDATIFCTPHHVEKEIMGCLEFMDCVYSTLGLSFQLNLSTRPDKYMGDLDTWNQAEKILEECLNKFGKPWQVDPGQGAFYGPKIDVTIQDWLGGTYQCGTIHLDYQLPERLNLSYIGESGEKKRPVMIHRAILGSVETMIAILSVVYKSQWPFWLSPKQFCVVPEAPVVADVHDEENGGLKVVPEDFELQEHAIEVNKRLISAGFMSEVKTSHWPYHSGKVKHWVWEAQHVQFNCILMVGYHEKSSGTVKVIKRDKGGMYSDDVSMSIQTLIDKFNELVRNKTLD